jgi:ring-1,2-phenylacetyl-CoA epoxidase subunit PaaC
VDERELLLQIADDELVLGWRNSEWTGIAPMLEEDVAFSSIAQNEIGHARAIYQLLSEDADALALDREPAEYRSSPLVELRFVPDWARTIARHVLYETADELRIARLKESADARIAGLASKIDREEAYHRMHAQMWAERLRDESRYREALEQLWPAAAATLEPELRPELAAALGFEIPSNTVLLAFERGQHVSDWAALWQEMTMVRRSVPGAAW